MRPAARVVAALILLGAAAYGCIGALSAVVAMERPVPEPKLRFQRGEIVRSGPLYEVTNISVDKLQPRMGQYYEFQPIHFKDFRGKWLVLFFAPLDDGEPHYKAGQDNLPTYLAALHGRLQARLPSAELWFVRMNRAWNIGSMSGGLVNCTYVTQPNFGRSACYDRFIYAAYHQGGELGFWIKPQLAWLHYELVQARVRNTDSEMLPRILIVDPEGRLVTAMPEEGGPENSVVAAHAVADSLVALAATGPSS